MLTSLRLLNLIFIIILDIIYQKDIVSFLIN